MSGPNEGKSPKKLLPAYTFPSDDAMRYEQLIDGEESSEGTDSDVKDDPAQEPSLIRPKSRNSWGPRAPEFPPTADDNTTACSSQQGPDDGLGQYTQSFLYPFRSLRGVKTPDSETHRLKLSGKIHRLLRPLVLRDTVGSRTFRTDDQGRLGDEDTHTALHYLACNFADMLGPGASAAALRPVLAPSEVDKKELGQRTGKVYDHLNGWFGRIYAESGTQSDGSADAATKEEIIKEYDRLATTWPADSSRPTLTDLPQALTAWMAALRATDRSMPMPPQLTRG